MRAVDGSGELPVASYELFSSTEMLGGWRWSGCWPGSRRGATRSGWSRSARGTEKAAATSKSAVSRRFVAQTETALAQLLGADLSRLDLVAFMVDGVHFGEHTCIVALGIDIDGVKHPLALVEGSTENATLVTELIVGLRERGLDVTRPILAVLDGSKALRRAVLDVFDHPVIGRCQLHKIRNVRRSAAREAAHQCHRRMRRAYHADSALAAEAELWRWPPSSTAPTRRGGQPARGHGRDPDGAAPGRPAHLARTLRSTNAMETMISICRDHAAQRQALARRADGAALVRRRDGRGGQAVPPRQRPHAPADRCAPRWNGSRPNLSAAAHNDSRDRRLMITGPPPKFHGTRDILGGEIRGASRPTRSE